MDLQAIIGQLYLVNGQAQEGTVPGVLAQSAPARAAHGRERDFLFVHLTLSGSVEETAVLTQDLLDAISNRYYRETGSVTAALRRAILEVNDLLLRLNLSGSHTPRQGAVTGAVLRQGELFMVQAGESLALLGHNFGVERLPAHPPDRVIPLGQKAGLDVRYFHQRLQPGDILLFADPRISHLPVHALQPALVDTTVELGLEVLKTAVGNDSARLLLVEFTDEPPVNLPEAAQPVKKSTPISGPSPLPRRKVSTAPQVAAPYRKPQPERERFRTFVARTPALEDGETLPTTARRATAGAAMGLSKVTGGLADALGQLRPATPSNEPASAWIWPILVAVLIPVLVAAVVTGVYLQRGQLREFSAIRQEMIQTMNLAEESSEQIDISRNHYIAVLQLADEAEEIRPGDSEVNRLRDMARHALDRLDDITRLTAVPFFTYDETVNLKGVVLREGFNGGIFTLDTNSNVYQFQTDESYLNLTTPEPALLLFKTQALGAFTVGNVIDLLWRPQGSNVSREGVSSLDATGSLITFYPNFADTRAVPLDFASQWQLPVAVTTYDERLYILDVGAGTIWKYFPDGEAFLLRDDEQTLSLGAEAELDKAVDIAIYSEDASLVVLYGDGRIRYYDTANATMRWNETDLLSQGLSYPMSHPVAVEIVGRGSTASIFVLDAGSGRLIQISRGGTVVAQYRATGEQGQELFVKASDFAVAETPLRVFVTAGNSLYVATQE